jgi:peroxiredoxin
MNIRNMLIPTLLSICLAGISQNNRIELPLKKADGYGPFRGGAGGISFYSEDENNPWQKTYLHIEGIPSGWTDVKEGAIDTDIYQTVYQHYHAGNITEEWYRELQESWNWTPDTLSLHKGAIRNKIAFIYGKNQAGEMKMMIDANNNHDFSDDAVFSPPEIDLESDFNKDSLLNDPDHKIEITCERLLNNQVVRETAPLVIFRVKPYDIFMCTFPQHAVTHLEGNEIAVSFNDFTNLDAENISIISMNDHRHNGENVSPGDPISKNEFLTVDNELYKNLGIDKNKNVLILEKIPLPKEQIESTQSGFRAIAFEGHEFTTGEKITLNDFRGKYLLIDFWAVWCGPCLNEFPFLKTLYDDLDRSKVEFIGIVGDSPSDHLAHVIDKHRISWPQILSDETNGITRSYHISGYPTTFLIDPQGVIIAKNIRGQELEDRLKELLRE